MNNQITEIESISAVSEQDRTKAIETLVLAFSSDPQLRFMFPDPLQYQTYAFDFFKAFGGSAFGNKTAHQAGNFSGVALWLPPDAHPDDDEIVNVIHKGVNPAKISTIMNMIEQMDHYQPKEPHWHLPLMGTDPSKKGQGYGTALLKYGLDIIDRERSIAYLENTNPRNKPVYERHGFNELGVIKADDSPPLFPMIRYPK